MFDCVRRHFAESNALIMKKVLETMAVQTCVFHYYHYFRSIDVLLFYPFHHLLKTAFVVSNANMMTGQIKAEINGSFGEVCPHDVLEILHSFVFRSKQIDCSSLKPLFSL